MEKRCKRSLRSFSNNRKIPLLPSLHWQLPLFANTRTLPSSIFHLSSFFSIFVFFGYPFDSIAIILCLQAYGPSMLPTLNIAGDVVLVEHVSPRIGKVGHGDLVLVKSPLNPNRNLTKRVVAMEGDTVTYFDPLNSEDSRIAVVCLLNGLFCVFSFCVCCFISSLWFCVLFFWVHCCENVATWLLSC